jgi:hypothetical protein
MAANEHERTHREREEAGGAVLHVCSIAVTGCNYAALCDDRAVWAFMASVARAIGAPVESGPYGTSQLEIGCRPYTVLWVLALVGLGSISFNAQPGTGVFHLLVSSSKPVERARILAVVERYFGETDSVGRKVARNGHLVAQKG